MPKEIIPVTKTISKLTKILAHENIVRQLQSALKDNTGLFTSSLVELVSSTPKLQECDLNELVREALKGASLGLPLSKDLGCFWIIPRKNYSINKWEPKFQLGYRAHRQLSILSGHYKHINDGVIYEGEYIAENRLSGEMDICGEKKSDKVTHFFAYLETHEGFKKSLSWTYEKMFSHAKRYAPTWNPKTKSFQKGSSWDTHFNEMARKTMTTALLDKWGIKTYKMIKAMEYDREQEKSETNDISDAEVLDTKPIADKPKAELRKPDF